MNGPTPQIYFLTSDFILLLLHLVWPVIKTDQLVSSLTEKNLPECLTMQIRVLFFFFFFLKIQWSNDVFESFPYLGALCG